MATYLVDLENTGLAGLAGLEELSAKDKVIIFYGTRTGSIAFDKHVELTKARADVTYTKTERVAKNYLDFQLVTYLGYLIGSGQERVYYIISKDKGYDSCIEFWRKTDKQIAITRCESLQRQKTTTQAGAQQTAANKQTGAGKGGKAAAVKNGKAVQKAEAEGGQMVQNMAAENGQTAQNAEAQSSRTEQSAEAQSGQAAQKAATQNSRAVQKAETENGQPSQDAAVQNGQPLQDAKAQNGQAAQSVEMQSSRTEQKTETQSGQTKAQKDKDTLPERAEAGKQTGGKKQTGKKNSAKKVSAQNHSGQKPSGKPALPESMRKKVRAAVKEEKLSGGSYKFIYDYIVQAPDKQKLNVALVKQFQQEKGNRLYKEILNVFAEYQKQKAEEA